MSPTLMAIALGVSSNATGQFSTATGVYSQATGENSLALGGFLGLSTDNTDLFRFTQATAARAIAIANAAQGHAEAAVEIGRAWRRESVCQYGSIEGVGVELKKKKQNQ